LFLPSIVGKVCVKMSRPWHVTWYIYICLECSNAFVSQTWADTNIIFGKCQYTSGYIDLIPLVVSLKEMLSLAFGLVLCSFLVVFGHRTFGEKTRNVFECWLLIEITEYVAYPWRSWNHTVSSLDASRSLPASSNSAALWGYVFHWTAEWCLYRCQETEVKKKEVGFWVSRFRSSTNISERRSEVSFVLPVV